MQLDDAQLKQFDEEGFIFVPDLFSTEEVAVLKGEIPEVFAQRRPEVIREASGEAVRTAFATHTYNDVYRRFVSHPRILEPAQQLLGGEVYIHQFKLNGKAAFDGEVWQWHQDYGTWQRDDDMPEARAMNLAVFLDEVNEFNGPLYIVPKSHKTGVLDAGHDVETTSYPLWTLDQETVAGMVDRGGIAAPKGPPGSGFFFHGTLVHGSPPNMSPWDRGIFSLILNPLANALTRHQRPDYKHHRDLSPVTPLADDCLLAATA